MCAPAPRFVALLVAALLTGCAQLGPTPECEQAPSDVAAELTCHQAVLAALAVFPGNHPVITRIQFLYGDFQGSYYHSFAWHDGYVVVTFVDGVRRGVQLHETVGKLAIDSPQPY